MFLKLIQKGVTPDPLKRSRRFTKKKSYSFPTVDTVSPRVPDSVSTADEPFSPDSVEAVSHILMSLPLVPNQKSSGSYS